MQLKVDSVSEHGTIFIPCECTELEQQLSENTLKKYFVSSKSRYSKEGIGYFSLVPSDLGYFSFYYNDNYFVAPKLNLRPTYRHWNNSVGDIATGVTASGADNTNAGWYEVKWKHTDCRIIQK